MTEPTKKKAQNMIYSPDHHIPLGQAVKSENGEYGLRVKKDKTTFEFIPINNLISQIIRVADSNV